MSTIDDLLQQLQYQFGHGSIMRLGERTIPHLPTVPTGTISLDLALGVGGYPRGYITELFGSESTGKTSIALRSVSEVQKQGGQAALIDAEHNLDIEYAKRIGVNVSNLLLSQPDHAEQAFNIIEALISSGTVDLIVLDSVAALAPKAEVEGSMSDETSALQSALFSQFLSKISNKLHDSKTALILINQLRNRPGFPNKYAEITLGGRPVRFYSMIRIETSSFDTIREDGEPIGHTVKVKIVKNKLAPIFQEAYIDLIYGEGISSEASLIDIGIEKNIIEARGSWFYFNNRQLGQGRNNARNFLKQHQDIKNQIEELLRSDLEEDIVT